MLKQSDYYIAHMSQNGPSGEGVYHFVANPRKQLETAKLEKKI
jgi:hypothetical protein